MVPDPEMKVVPLEFPNPTMFAATKLIGDKMPEVNPLH
jgi:hypothetical protein